MDLQRCRLSWQSNYKGFGNSMLSMQTAYDLKMYKELEIMNDSKVLISI